MFELEILEEGLLSKAHSEGMVDVLRRPDADPRAVLGLIVKAKTEAAA